MQIHKVKITVSGFTKEQIEIGIPNLLDELKHRPWIKEPEAYLDEPNSTLVVIVGYEVDFRLEEATKDEISDCIIATMNFDKEISFKTERLN